MIARLSARGVVVKHYGMVSCRMLTEVQEEILHHLGYEWWMFRATHALLLGMPVSDDPKRNALLESLLMHTRQLIDFFFKVESEKGPRQSDLTVEKLDCGLSRQEERKDGDLWKWREMVNKRVLHLTEARRMPIAEWHLELPRRALQRCIDEIKEKLPVPPGWIGDAPVGPTGSALQPPSQPIGATGPAGPSTR